MTPHDYLHSFANFETKLNSVTSKDFSLGRVEELLGFLGDPHKQLTVIHVAGTKGKGSTCAFISYILAHAGYKVGLYTSPHLHRLNERIRILDKGVAASTDDFYGMITDDHLAEIISRMRPHIASLYNRGIELTFFEVLTVIALVYFKEQNVNYVVLETGLGGRLDATNVVSSKVAVITPISLDHMHILGSTLKEIAQEKAGIIKSSLQKVIIAPQEDIVEQVLFNHCGEYGIDPVLIRPREKAFGSIWLKGEHQQTNAAVAAQAVMALKIFGRPAHNSLVDQAIATTRWAGRFEVLQEEPLVIADGAHNQASARALVRTVKDNYPDASVTLILGMSVDKDVAAVAAELKPMADTVITTKAAHPRAHEFSRQQTQELFQPKSWFVTKDIQEALELAQSRVKKNELILITGSLFIVAQARKHIHVSI